MTTATQTAGGLRVGLRECVLALAGPRSRVGTALALRHAYVLCTNRNHGQNYKSTAQEHNERAGSIHEHDTNMPRAGREWRTAIGKVEYWP